ncbi:MAG TPA: adenosine deaminase [Candidatus Angelobacter sp.]|jgi:adenosine deaminase/aminodeoxyfutalosine deaminase|nr:adenosine deaminase [Candidatus Angelobacter sp.]
MASKSFIQSLPKAELHLHLEGSVDPATLAELSRRYHMPLPTENNRYDVAGSGDVLTEDDVRRLYSYKDFNGFLMAFKSVTERLRSPEDYELVTYRLMQKLRQQNVVHAEVYVSVGVIRWRGQPVEPIFEGLERGRERGQRDFGVSLLWIFDAVRHFGPQAAKEVFDLAARLRERNVVGIGIGGDEARGPAEGFRDLYKTAADNGLRLTAHAGETTGPESVWGALNIGAERIGHGLSAASDPELMEAMAQKQVPVEMCITSNLRTGACKELEEHPVRKFFDEGLMVTLSTDDPAMFQTSLNKEYEIAKQEFNFSEEHLRELARNSIEASFLPVEKKLRFMQQIDFLA